MHLNDTFISVDPLSRIRENVALNGHFSLCEANFGNELSPRGIDAVWVYPDSLILSEPIIKDL